MNRSFHKKVRSLEEEAGSLQEQLRQTQRGIREEEKENKSSALVHQFDLQKQKLVSTEAKLKMLQQRQQEMRRLLRLRGKGEERIAKLEGETERLRNQREILKRELKEQGERKSWLEAEVERCQRRLSELQTCTDQQRKVLKVKTEEVCVWGGGEEIKYNTTSPPNIGCSSSEEAEADQREAS